MAYRISHEGVPEKKYLEHHQVGEGEGCLSKHEREEIKILIVPSLWIVLESATALAQKATHSGCSPFW